MKKINCLIADDEEIARDIIESYVRQLDRLNVAGHCTNGIEVYNALQNNSIDLIFLDIQMPQLTGIELLRTLKKPPAIILITAFREFALEGYELNVIDYLLKPVAFERFIKAVDKYESFRNPGNNINSAEKISSGVAEGFIYVKSEKKMVRVLLKDILYIEGLKDYVSIHLAGRSIITYRTLTYFVEQLSGDHFLRVHRSFIISLHHISAYSATQIDIDQFAIPIGHSYGKEVLQRLGN